MDGKLTIQSVASRLDGTEYPLHIPEDLKAECKAAGIVIVYGASDDLMEFDGAIYDEVGAYNGTSALVDSKGLLSREDAEDDEEIADYVNRKRGAQAIAAIWGRDGASWQYETTIHHATFDVVEDGDIYCRGIVFDLAALTEEAK